MKVLVAGGVFRLNQEEIRRQQPAPEIVLATGLQSRGVEVETCKLEDRHRIFFSSKYDIVHVHHLSRGAVAAALSPCRGKFVFTAHGMGRLESTAQRFGAHVIFKKADVTICLSDAERNYRTRLSPAIADRLTVIPNGIDFFNRPPVHRHWNRPQPFQLLFVGQLIDLKRVDRILQAMTRHPSVRLRLVYHNAANEHALRRLSRSLGLSERVDFVGKLAGSQLADEYYRANGLALPSVTEALPSVVTEALSTGLPVLASRVGGISQQVADAGFLSDPADDRGISRSIGMALEHYEQLSEAAFRRSWLVRKVYSVDQMIDSHVELYRKVLGV